MRGGLRWLTRPFQVLCVLVAVLLTAAFSLRPSVAGHAGGIVPVPDKPDLGSLGERLNADTISIIFGNPNATYLTSAYDLADDQFVAQRDGDGLSGADRDRPFQQSLDWQAHARA
jgi:hypothetical protein